MFVWWGEPLTRAVNLKMPNFEIFFLNNFIFVSSCFSIDNKLGV